MIELTLKFYTPEEKTPEEKRIVTKQNNTKDALLLAVNKDGEIVPACFTEQGDGVYSIKGRTTKKPIRDVIMWAEVPEEIC